MSTPARPPDGTALNIVVLQSLVYALLQELDEAALIRATRHAVNVIDAHPDNPAAPENSQRVRSRAEHQVHEIITMVRKNRQK